MAATTFVGAGDVLDGTARLRAVPRRDRRPGLIGGALGVLFTVLGILLGALRADPSLIVDAAAVALVVSGTAVLFGGGWALIVAGLGLALLREFGGDRTPGS